MKKTRRKVLLGMSILLVLFLAGAYSFEIYMDHRVPVAYTERILGIPVVEDLSCLNGKEQRAATEQPGVLFGQAQVPCTADGTLYLAQDQTSDTWVGELTTDSRDTYLCMLPDTAWDDKKASVRDNHVFRLYLVGSDYYYPLRLVICGMPVMTLHTDRVEEQDLGVYEDDPDHFYYDPDKIFFGTMQLFDPAADAAHYQILETGARFYIRGASSAHFDKKSYALGLLDAKGAKLDQSLLGMRSDNSWKLKAMVQDGPRVREKSAYQIWEQFADTNTEVNEAGPRMEYLELIIDGDYVGLYGLLEPVDAKKLALDKNDALYKVTGWMEPEDEDIQYAVDHRWRIMSLVRVRYPDVITDYAKTWYPMRDYLNTFYHGGGDERPAEQKVYISNAVDMLLFNMAVSGSDNFYKNIYFAADVDTAGSYVMRQIPWDLDMTFGQHAIDGFLDDETLVYEEEAVPYLMEKDPTLVQPYLRTRWSQVRSSFLDAEQMLQILYDNQEYLLQAGAEQRENARWPKYPMTTDLTQVTDLLYRRIDWLDAYFAAY